MIVIPAVDVRGGRCVRLVRGDYAQETVYAEDPAQCALAFVRRGARRVHIVDLDAARGVPDILSRDAVRRAVRAVHEAGSSAEVGGGIRSGSAATSLLECGADYVILGSVAIRDQATAAAICAQHPHRVLLGLDVLDGVVRAQGWTQAAGRDDDVLATWSRWPAAGIVRTEISRDGVMQGPDVPGVRACMARYPGPVYASGGVTTVDDLVALSEAGVAGAVIGRALYEGRFHLDEALRRFGADEVPSR